MELDLSALFPMQAILKMSERDFRTAYSICKYLIDNFPKEEEFLTEDIAQNLMVSWAVANKDIAAKYDQETFTRICILGKVLSALHIQPEKENIN